MPNDIHDLRDTVIAKTDQLNAEALLSGPMTIRVTSVERGSAEQPLVVHFEGDNGRPWKPGKSSRKVLIFAWGEDGAQWVGRYATLYNKTDVKWAGVEVGGIRISHLSDIRADITIALTATRGKKEPITVKRLVLEILSPETTAALTAAAARGRDSLLKAHGDLTPSEKAALGRDTGLLAALRQAAANADTPPTTTTE